jgi:hypothetical protein
MAAQRITSRSKVYITRIGLKDWLVAATSQKAALEAWDVHRNLFATGEARLTNDPSHVEIAMRTPGVPVAAPGARSAEIVELAPHRKGGAKAPRTNIVNLAVHRAKGGGHDDAKGEARSAPTPKSAMAKPDRSKLEAVERELREYEREAARTRAEIEKRKRTIETELEAFDAQHERQRARLAKRIAREREALEER